MNSKRSKFVQVMIVVVVMLGLLIAAWPGVAQSNQPPTRSAQRVFLENRIQDPGQYPLFAALPPDQPDQINNLASWPITNFGLNGAHPSIAIDTYGQPHILDTSFYMGNSFYATFDAQIWHIEDVIGGQDPSLALDRANQPHYTYSNNGLEYAYRDLTGWHFEIIAAVGSHSQLAMGNDNRPQVVFIDGGLKYAYRDNTGWHSEPVANSVSEVALALDTALRPHVLYVGDGLLYYGFRDATGWHLQSITNADNFPGRPAIDVDSHNRPHISYCAWCRNYYGGVPHVNYGYYNGNTWQIESVPPAHYEGWTNSIMLDADDKPHIAYSSNADGFGKLRHAQKTAAGWKVSQLDAMYTDNPYGEGQPKVSLAIDPAGRPHIAYFVGAMMYDGGTLRYTYRQTDLSNWSRLAFASYRNGNWEIYTANGDGSGQARRTDHSAVDTVPKLNRSASRIAFVSTRDLNYEIYTANSDGSGPTRLTKNSADDYWPNWSPDSQQIAFQSARDGNVEIYTMNADGTGVTRLTNCPAWDGQPAWSPDGAQIAFVSNRGGRYDLWVMNRDGSNLRQLTTNLDAAYPSWAPDGTQIAFSDDSNGDTWFDISTIYPDGTHLVHRIFGSGNNDNIGPSWSPSGQDLVFASVHWVLYQGQYYWDSANIYRQELASGAMQAVTTSGRDWWSDWQTTDVWPSSSQVKALTLLHNTTQFTLWWSGADIGPANLMSYDIQYRDGLNGTWTDWLTATIQISATFTGQYGHTYYFRSRARDYANNLEDYPSSPDAMTTLYQYIVSGQMLDNREQPVAVVNVQSNPVAIYASFSGHNGAYDLYLASSGVYTLTAIRSNFDPLPPLLDVTVPRSYSLPTLYLPPIDNQISDSHFESGDLSAWNLGSELTPTITSTAHTGLGAVVLGGTVPTDTVTTGPWHSTIEQTISVSPTIVSGTLSLLYRVESAEPLSDTLTAYAAGANNVLTFTVPVTAGEWTHAWFDISTWNEPTATLKIDFAIAETGREARIILDEITWGSAIEGSLAVFLPIARR